MNALNALTVTAANRRNLTLADCDAQWTRRPTAEVARRAERFRKICRDRILAGSYLDLSTLRHFGGLIVTLDDRGEDTARLALWFREICAA